MAMVKLHFELDINNPAEKVALSELRKWKALLNDGQKAACLKKQKETFMAGLYLQIAMPELTTKLAHSLLSTDIEDFNHFYQRCYGALKNNDQQNEMLKRLGALQQVLNEKLPERAMPLVTSPAHSQVDVLDTVDCAQENQRGSSDKVNATALVADKTDVSLDEKLKKISKIKAKKLF